MNSEFVQMSADVVCAYVSKNPVPAGQVPALLEIVHGALEGMRNPPAEPVPPAPTPVVPIGKSVLRDELICLHCGKGFRSIKRHLVARHQQSPDQYREMFGLPKTYPLVPPSYAEQRARIAKRTGLGGVHKKGA